MAKATDKAHEEHLEEQRDELLEEFMALATVNRGYDDFKEQSWLN